MTREQELDQDFTDGFISYVEYEERLEALND